jgi:hypothetical protein
VPALTAEVLRVWRSSEQLGGELPPLDPDRAAIERLAAEMHELYQQVSVSLERTNDNVRKTLQAIERADRILDAVRGRLGNGASLEPGPG